MPKWGILGASGPIDRDIERSLDAVVHWAGPEGRAVSGYLRHAFNASAEDVRDLSREGSRHRRTPPEWKRGRLPSTAREDG